MSNTPDTGILEQQNQWNIIQTCGKGQKHAVCQDSCSHQTTDHISVMTLCDGTSSSEHADIGAKYVAEFTSCFFHNHFEELFTSTFNQRCKLLTNYHQTMLMYLAKYAEEETGIQLFVGKKLQTGELQKFCTTVQVVALNGMRGIYFKVGNGAAVIASTESIRVLSDSSTQSPTMHVTLPYSLSMLFDCEFSTFELESEDYAIGLTTDGVEFEEGLYCGKTVRPAYEHIFRQILNKNYSQEHLEAAVQQLHESPSNYAKDDIGVSIAYRNLVGITSEEFKETAEIKEIEEFKETEEFKEIEQLEEIEKPANSPVEDVVSSDSGPELYLQNKKLPFRKKNRSILALFLIGGIIGSGFTKLFLSSEITKLTKQVHILEKNMHDIIHEFSLPDELWEFYNLDDPCDDI